MNLVVVTAVLEEEIRVEWVQECVEMGSGEMETARLDNCFWRFDYQGEERYEILWSQILPLTKRGRERN